MRRRPAKTEESIKMDEIFVAIKEMTGLKTILDPGFTDMAQRFQATYKDGMTTEDAIAAYKG